MRDKYCCRYCGITVMDKSVRGRLAGIFGDLFLFTRDRGGDLASHPVSTALCAVVDHVVAQTRGGSDDSDNLVTACGPCNYPKGDAGLAAVGLADPFARLPTSSPWDGGMPVLRIAQDRIPHEFVQRR